MEDNKTNKSTSAKSVSAMYSTIIMSGPAISVMNLFLQRIHYNWWAVWAFPVAYIISLVFAVIGLVRSIKIKRTALIVFYALFLAFDICLLDNMTNCVKDITGGTKQVETQYYWAYGRKHSSGNKIRLYTENNDELELGFPKKSDVDKYLVFCAEDEKVIENVKSFHGRMYMAKISYYPNNGTVKEMHFEKREGLTEWEWVREQEDQVNTQK